MLDKLKYFWSKTNRWHRVIALFLLVELKVLPGGQLGFQCNDPALSHPFTGDTISWKWLMGITLFLPLVIMLIVERQCNGSEKNELNKRNALRWYKEYVYGVLINLTVIQTLKLIVGSPRPHFFDTCQPEEAITCVESEYISSYTCTKAYWLSQSDKSFPSGHTSLGLHAAVFIAYYLHRRAIGASGGSESSGRRAVWAAQAVCILSAAWCGISRIRDRRHHWWDVLAGAVIAAPILLYTIKSLCKDFCCSPSSNVEEETKPLESNCQS
ncbi:PREDICTED: lipid phosphate phosphohydrolase 1-like [Papilio polytes]|uniref:lipid phosphate phosphohydrolase 1-like n=1 Tax=Papilio polytes TaxID=76194 RepID=UPI00067653E8|nr:PREDICTED: lipid phosphate phosphohydrolase 1-like [Papilio polytes]